MRTSSGSQPSAVTLTMMVPVPVGRTTARARPPNVVQLDS